MSSPGRLLGIHFSVILATSLVRMIFHYLPASLESRGSIMMWTVSHFPPEFFSSSTLRHPLFPSAGEISPGMCHSEFEMFHKLYTLEATSEHASDRIFFRSEHRELNPDSFKAYESIKLGVLVGWVGHHQQVLISRFPLVRFSKTGFTSFGLAQPND